MFSTVKHAMVIRVYFGGSIITVNAPQVLPIQTEIWGAGWASAGVATSFVNGNMTGVPIFTLGADKNPAYAVQMHDFSVDCRGLPGTTGVYTDQAEENSYIKDFAIFGCQTGLSIQTSGSQNSGPWQNGIIYMTKGKENIGVSFGGTAGLVSGRNIDNITVMGNDPKPAAGMLLASAVQVTNCHCEGVVDCFLVTDHGVTISQVNGSTNPGSVINVVHVIKGVQYINLFNISQGNPGNVTLLDDVYGTALKDYNLGYYLTGSYGGHPIRITSSAAVPSSFYGPQIVPTGAAPFPCASNADIGKLWVNGSLVVNEPVTTCTTNATGWGYVPLQWAGQYDQPAPAGTITLDAARGQLQSVTLTRNSVVNLGVGFPGQTQTVEICNGGTNYSITWGPPVRGGGRINTGPNRCQAQTFAADDVKLRWVATAPPTDPY